MSTSSTKKGTLTIAGSGIASVGHITLETLSHIKEADKVFYAVADPVTEGFIQSNSKGDHFDLSVFYDKDKPRYATYVQMCEVMMREVRGGHAVLGIFYGHPGVFVSPSHRAIAIALEEGYEAKMLPGVSAEDYLFADLGFDPAVYGCMTQEATALLARKKSLDTTVHNIIWQVGGVGVGTMVFNNDKFHLLVDLLEAAFGADHKIVHYIGAVLPQSTTVMDDFTIADLRKEEIIKQIKTASTFYVPPRQPAEMDQTIIHKLGLSEGLVAPAMQLYPRPKCLNANFAVAPAYGSYEKDAVAKIDAHVIPEDHKSAHSSTAMQKFMVDLALHPNLLKQYKEDPVTLVNAREGLKPQEKFALSFNRAGPVFAVMLSSPKDIADGREVTVEEIAGTAEVSYSPFILVILSQIRPQSP